jgi:hypothetical protein
MDWGTVAASGFSKTRRGDYLERDQVEGWVISWSYVFSLWLGALGSAGRVIAFERARGVYERERAMPRFSAFRTSNIFLLL